MERPNIVLDLGDNQDVSKAGWKGLEDSIREIGAEFYMVAGNHENFELLMVGENKNQQKFLLPNKKYVNVEGMTIAGIGGVLSPVKYDDKMRLSEETINERIQNIKKDLYNNHVDLDIFISHSFPKTNTLEKNYEIDKDNFYKAKTSKPYGDAIYLLKPKLALSGHLHGYAPIMFDYEYGVVINMAGFTDGGNYAIIEVSTNPFKVERISFLKFNR